MVIHHGRMMNLKDKLIDNIESFSDINFNYKRKNKQIYNESISMEKLYINISDPLVEPKPAMQSSSFRSG